MAKSSNPNVLFVEGEDEKRVIPYFMEKFIAWGDRPDVWPVHIEQLGGIESLLQEGVIEAKLKTSGLKALGVVVDADSDPPSRWRRVRARISEQFPTSPIDIPHDGLVLTNDEGLKFGAWVMPDNISTGMLETFLAYFVTNPATSALWDCVTSHCDYAKESHYAPYNLLHLDKARIHAWLALQDPPGQQMHSAIMQNILRPESTQAEAFVNWFCRLFGTVRIT